MKTYVITLSRVFPAYHPKRGTQTDFYAKIVSKEKKHTIRANYKLWKNRIDEVDAGIAVLSVREWTGKPYNSPQKELFRFNNTVGIGVQKVVIGENFAEIDGKNHIAATGIKINLAANDGLSLVDFKDWFKKYPVDPMAIIHFTDFRY